MLLSPRQCWRVGSAFYNLNKCRIHGNSRMERCYSDSKSARMWMILLRRAEKCTLRGMSMGSRSLHPSRLQDVRWNSGCRPQVTSGIWRGIGCVHIHTHPLQQWEHQRRVCNTPQEPQEQPKPGYQKIAEMLGETKPNRGILPNPCSFDGHPSQSHSEKLRRFTSLKIWTTYKPRSQPHALAWCYNYSTAFNHCLQPLKLETDLQTRMFQQEGDLYSPQVYIKMTAVLMMQQSRR